MNGMPQTAAEAAVLTPVPVPGDAINLTGDPAAGLVVFTNQCVQCHGENGAEGVANPDSDDGNVPLLNPIDPEIKGTDLKSFVLNVDLFIQSGSTPPGANPKLKMPAFGQTNLLTQQQIADVIAYIISLNK
jgi:mono/diheme cytochrome c family protein